MKIPTRMNPQKWLKTPEKGEGRKGEEWLDNWTRGRPRPSVRRDNFALGSPAPWTACSELRTESTKDPQSDA
jgi:hypothetical protein